MDLQIDVTGLHSSVYISGGTVYSDDEISIPKGTPKQIVKQARTKIAQYNSDNIIPTRFRAHDGESLSVGRRYRLLRKNKHSVWQLMTHERYNRLKDTIK